jgi:hypothetical protein
MCHVGDPRPVVVAERPEDRRLAEEIEGAHAASSSHYLLALG